jgi:dihydroxyacetone kinase-like protein
MAAVDEQRDALNELDRRSGDGDFGANLEAAVARIRRRLDGAATVSGVFAAVSGAFLDTGGTSGPLYGIWLRALARSAEGADAVRLEALAAGATEVIAARRGRASYVGDVARGVLDPGAVTVALFFETAPIPGEPR